MIEIKLTKYRVFLTEDEIIKLLSRDPELWEAAIKRGKAFIRARQARARNSKAPAKCREPDSTSNCKEEAKEYRR